MKRTLIKVNEQVINQEKLISRGHRKSPKCPTCKVILNIIFRYKEIQKHRIGYICPFCNSIFINNKFKCFIVKIEEPKIIRRLK